jgi:hypothetical protein
MRPFPPRGWKYFLAQRLTLYSLLAGAAICGGGCANVASIPSPPAGSPGPQTISVTVTPSSGLVMLGNQLLFTAAVKNSSDSAVSWSVNGVAGGAAQTGTITTGGLYTAPGDLPIPANLMVTATSHADVSKSGSAIVTVQSDVSITLPSGGGTGAVPVELGATHAFLAVVGSGAHPDKSVLWSVSGPSCPLLCGSVDASGNYTAPQILPSSPNVTLTARGVADSSKQVSAAVTITSNFLLQLSVPSTVPVSSTATFMATLTPVPGSNPSTVLSWSLSGSGCNGVSCGTLNVVTEQSAGGNATATSASYTSPISSPAPNTIVVTVTPLADPSKAVRQQFSIQVGVSEGIGVTVFPATATRAINHHLTLTAQVSGTANANVAWNVNGLPGGSTAVGQICVVASNPCQLVTSGTALPVDYVAPAAVPTPDPVTVQAVSAADATKSGASQVTIINHVLVTVLPGSALLVPLGVQPFIATVLGTDNQNVVWQIQGAGCSAAGICGAITPAGVYTAPGGAPTPDALQVVAISSEDPSQSGVANVTISTGVNILTLHPASVYAGAANGFTLKVIGTGFASSTSGSGAVLLIGGTARTTTCSTAQECIAPVTAADVALAGNVSVQVQNPGGTESNAVSLVVAVPNASDDVISLSTGAPEVSGKDIVVVEPTTAGVSVPGNDVDLDVAALGSFSAVNNSCTLGGNPVLLTRPQSGVATADVCLFSQSGLDASMSFTVTGPGDVAVIAKQPLGLGIIRLTLQLPATAAPSARTLFIQNTNLDKTAATGTLWVK